MTSEQQIDQMCSALAAFQSTDAQQRIQAEQFIHHCMQQQSPGTIESLLTITMSQDFNNKYKQDVSQQAIVLLKQVVNQCWQFDKKSNFLQWHAQDKDNSSVQISEPNKQFLKANILAALDQLVMQQSQGQNKMMVSTCENIIYNIAQCDYLQWNQAQSNFNGVQCSELHKQLIQRITSGQEQYLISGLRALKSLVEAYEYEINADRKPLEQLVEVFFPIIESQILANNQLQQSENYVPVMIIICKIFYMSNQITVSPYLLQPGKIAPWVDLFRSILETNLGAQFETQVNGVDEIQSLNKSPCWRLKGIVANITFKLFTKSATKTNTQQKPIDHFYQEFHQKHALELLQTHMSIINRYKTQFVGVKTLNYALRFVTKAIGNKKLYQALQPNLEDILFNITLPLMLIDQNEVNIWKENPVEFVRLQVDTQNPINVKRTNELLVVAICSIRQTRKNKISKYLTSYLNTICQTMQQEQPDQRQKEAVMYAFGLLHRQMAYDKGYQKNAEGMLQQFVFNELKSDNGFLKARAAWVYAQFGHFPINNEHLKYVLDALWNNLQNNDLPVRVNAAIAIIKLLSHEEAVDFLRPGLSQIIQIYLKLIDEIDYDELIKSLQVLVEIYDAEIAPYAENLCVTLAETYLRLMEQQKSKSGGNELELDSEVSLTTEGLMTAICRIINSLQGKFPEVYPKLEQIVQQPIVEALQDPHLSAIEYALSCLTEIIYYQPKISQNMWNFFKMLIDSVMNDQGHLDDYLMYVIVVLINFINKAPEQIAQMEYPGQPGQTCLSMLCQFIAKSFQNAELLDDEIPAISTCSLASAMLENLKGYSNQFLPGLLNLVLQQLQDVETEDLESMLLQTINLSLYCDTALTLQILEQSNATEHILKKTFEYAQNASEDFLVKKLMLGLTALLKSPNQMGLPPSVQQAMPDLMQALMFLSKRSIEIYEAEQQKKNKQKQEECEDENEAVICEDEEEHDAIDLDSDEDDQWEMDDAEDEDKVKELYNSPLDEIDEVLNLRDHLQQLEQVDGAFYKYLMSQVGQEQMELFSRAIDYANNIQQQQLLQQQQQ